MAQLSEAGHRRGRRRRSRRRLLARPRLRPDRRRHRTRASSSRTAGSASRPTAAPPGSPRRALPPGAGQAAALARPSRMSAEALQRPRRSSPIVTPAGQRLRRGALGSPNGWRRWRRTRSPAPRSCVEQAPRQQLAREQLAAERDHFLDELVPCQWRRRTARVRREARAALLLTPTLSLSLATAHASAPFLHSTSSRTSSRARGSPSLSAPLREAILARAVVRRLADGAMLGGARRRRPRNGAACAARRGARELGLARRASRSR